MENVLEEKKIFEKIFPEQIFRVWDLVSGAFVVGVDQSYCAL